MLYFLIQSSQFPDHFCNKIALDIAKQLILIGIKLKQTTELNRSTYHLMKQVTRIAIKQITLVIPAVIETIIRILCLPEIKSIQYQIFDIQSWPN